MSQHDYVIANADGATVRADVNSALAAVVSQNSGATEPSTTYAYQWWADTTTGILKQRNAANDGWVSILTMSTGLPQDASTTVKGVVELLTDAEALTGADTTRACTAAALAYVLVNRTAFEVSGGNSRDISLSTDWTISGLAGTPRAIICFWGENSTPRGGWGFWAATGGDVCEYFANAAQFSYGTPLIYYADGGGGVNQGSISSAASGQFTVAWTKGGSPTGTIYCQFLIFY